MTIKFKYVTYVLFCIVVGILVSCNTSGTSISTPATSIPEQEYSTEVDQSDQCIPPLYGHFSYPIDTNDQDFPIPGFNMFVVPPSPWEIEASLPEITNWDARRVDVVQTRRIDNYFEIWIHISRGIEKQEYLAMYRTDTKEWKILPEEIDNLIVDKSGLLWGSHVGYYGSAYESFENAILSKFDEDTNTFTPEENLQNLASAIEKDGNRYFSQVLLNSDGLFWILVPTDGIYRYNPVSKEVKRFFDLPLPFTNAKIDTDGTIYVLINDQSIKDGNLVSQTFLSIYSQDATQRSGFSIDLNNLLEPYPQPLSILIDHKNRIWLDNIAYISQDGALQQIQRSPLFLSTIKEFHQDYQYRRADAVLESSDGRIWFLHRNNGMISLDPEKGEWCWFTTYQSNIVEDSDHNLWMIADGKLYKNALGK